MADKNPMDSFMDLFKDFGSDLNLPSVEVDSILDHHRKNLQALQDAAQSASAGGQSLMAKQRAALEEALAEISDAVQNAPGAASDPGQAMSGQADLARKSFEMAVRNATEMGDIVRDSGTETFDILRARMEESLSELTGGMLGKKK